MSVYSGHDSEGSIARYKRELDNEKGLDARSLGDSSSQYTSNFDDPNLSPDEIGDIEEDSPYPEVRAAVANTDDPDMPCNTLRAWVIGMALAILIPGVNQFFFFRFPGINVGQLVAQLFSFPVGRLCARFLPRVSVFGIPLNPGPFSIKEHVLITIAASVGANTAYASNIVAVQRFLYGQNWGFMYQWMIILSTQIIGFSFCGFLRRYLVNPPSMIWPTNLVFCALFNTMHSQQYTGFGTRGGLSREKFFIIAIICSTCWYFVPGYLFSALSYFSWVCWIAPNNIVVNQMFGYFSGLGMSLITFDWAQIAYIGSPLATPFWASANVAGGFVVFFWILAPILYYTNTFYGANLPLLSRTVFDNTGAPYNVSRVLNADITFNVTMYEEYSPLFISTGFAIAYGLSFASITGVLVHTFLYYRRQIWIQTRRSLREQPDVHARLMAAYREVPDWWYLMLFVTMFVFAVLCIEVWPSELPVWALVLALVFSLFYMMPTGMIQAITNQQVGLNVITELIVGFVLPGRPVAMMMFKTWGFITMAQGLQFTSDQKLGHYMKVPPRAMFSVQVVGSVFAATSQLLVQRWMFSNIPGICKDNEVFSCPGTTVFGAASIVWGVIGPQRLFAHGQLYYPLTWFFLIGAVAPVVPWLLARRFPGSIWKYINFPVIFSGTSLIPPATAVNYVSWCLTAFVFQHVIRRRHFSWWAKYNYVLSAALDGGVAIGGVLIFFMLQYPRGGTIGANTVQKWWGNTVFLNTADANGASFLTPPAGGFGPKTW